MLSSTHGTISPVRVARFLISLKTALSRVMAQFDISFVALDPLLSFAAQIVLLSVCIDMPSAFKQLRSELDAPFSIASNTSAEAAIVCS